MSLRKKVMTAQQPYATAGQTGKTETQRLTETDWKWVTHKTNSQLFACQKTMNLFGKTTPISLWSPYECVLTVHLCCTCDPTCHVITQQNLKHTTYFSCHMKLPLSTIHYSFVWQFTLWIHNGDSHGPKAVLIVCYINVAKCTNWGSLGDDNSLLPSQCSPCQLIPLVHPLHGDLNSFTSPGLLYWPLFAWLASSDIWTHSHSRCYWRRAGYIRSIRLFQLE